MKLMDAAGWAGIGQFITTALSILVAPAAALVGALGGVAVANKRAAEREREQRAEARRDSARGLMVELVHSGRDWALKLQHTRLSAILDSMEIGDSASDPKVAEASERLGALRSRLEMAFTDILLRVDEPGLREIIERCRAEMDRSAEISAEIDRQIREKEAPKMQPVFDYVKEFRAALRTMEQAAIPYFAAPIR